jgi:hypothetical protein
MQYSLHVRKAAEAQLIRLWTSADSASRRAITQASHQIDQILMSPSAPTAGEPCPRPGLPTTRGLEVGPLGVEFVVMNSFREVQIRRYYLVSGGP